WDSLLAKLIVTGRDRKQALQRAARALAEFKVEGMATAIPFHRAVVADPAFTSEPFSIYTRWIETAFENTIPAFAGAAADGEDSCARETLVVEVDGRRIEISLPPAMATPAVRSAVASPARPKRTAARTSAASGDTLASPMQGTVVKVAVEEGQVVAEGELIVVLEAMKMEQPLNAHKAGTITSLSAEVGASVSSGAALCEIKD
ncbi:acetyl/propionyl-CoA carboxylase alpha subunit, partial [Kitasatospora sp. MAA4]|uniref:biotin/lipoyl-containing protein n=1 Tax=Kitasatospora sp. MAA4 TaxID=3035093 RepID=UPI0024732873